jgi:hypothetical protein
VNKDEKQVSKLGPGGFKCYCCGPAPKDRPTWRRLVRRRLKALHHKVIRQAMKED